MSIINNHLSCSEMSCLACDARTAALRARIAELEADREILDWIQAQAPNIFCLVDFDEDEQATGEHWEINDEFIGATFRDAVNAARAAEKEGA